MDSIELFEVVFLVEIRLALRCPVPAVLLNTIKYAVSELFWHEIKTLQMFYVVNRNKTNVPPATNPTSEVKQILKTVTILDAHF